jgi:hypothetical protein
MPSRLLGDLKKESETVEKVCYLAGRQERRVMKMEGYLCY